MKFEETGNTSDDLSTAVLFRSHIEITNILSNLARDEAVLTAEFGEPEQLFLTRLLDIDAEGAFFVVGYSQERRANRALLEQASVVFRANDKRGRIEFTVTTPIETVFAGAPAIRFPVPQLLIRSQRREHPRFSVPP